MKKRIILLTALLTISLLPLAACGQSDTTNKEKIKFEHTKSYDLPEEVPPTPDSCPDACPDEKDCPNECPPQDEQSDEDNPNTKPPEFDARHFRSRLPKRVKTFGFVVVMPAPMPQFDSTKMPSTEEFESPNAAEQD